MNGTVSSELERVDALTLIQLGKSVVTLGGLLTAMFLVAACLIAAAVITAGLRRVRRRSGQAAPSIYIV